MEKSQLIVKLDTYLNKLDEKKQPQNLHITDFKGFDYQFNKDATKTHFHSFGIGKLFTLSLVLILAEQKKVDLDISIRNYIGEDILNDLFVFRGKDYQNEVTLRHLLSHTSGIADYFEGVNHEGQKFVDLITKYPDQAFNPKSLLDFTKLYQSALGYPGNRFYYSDTGFVLIGLILESVMCSPYDTLIKTYITKPLNMIDTFTTDHLKENIELAPWYFNGHDLSQSKSISCHWAGGNIISTTSDLIKFIKALVDKKLFSISILDETLCCEFPFLMGLTYGLGMMEAKLEKFTFLYKTKKLPALRGHMSFNGTHLWVDFKNDIFICLNYGTNKYFEKGFKILAFIMNNYLTYNEAE